MGWLFLSSVLLDCYEATATPATYTNPDRSNCFAISMIGFVDDINGQVNKFDDVQNLATLLWLVDKAKANATTWAGLLGATGGALELSKCSYHIVYWKFSKQGALVLTNLPDEVPSLEVPDPHTNVHHQLEYLSPYTAHKTLGYHKEPAGGQIVQFQKLKEKSDSITEFLWKTPLSNAETWTYYTACYLPSVCCPLTGSHLTSAQLTAVQKKALSIIIPRCGYNRHTHISIIFGPRSLGGAGFKHLDVEQGVHQVTYFLRHWRLSSTMGKALQCVIAWAQLSVGVSYPILEYPQRPLPHLEALWIHSMRHFLARTATSFQLDKPSIPTAQREHDLYLMDCILQCNHYSPAEVRRLNYCRLFIGAVTVSDITLPCGTYLDVHKTHGQSSPSSSRNTQLQVHQGNPS